MAAKIVSGPAGLDWEVYAGDSNKETFEFLVGDDPKDITGATLAAQARKVVTDAAPAITATCAVTDGANGRATVAWDGALIRTLLGANETWTGVWDLQITEQGQTLPRTVLRGEFTARLDVTRP